MALSVSFQVTYSSFFVFSAGFVFRAADGAEDFGYRFRVRLRRSVKLPTGLANQPWAQPLSCGAGVRPAKAIFHVFVFCSDGAIPFISSDLFVIFHFFRWVRFSRERRG
jgi:hypothetical protein